MPKTKKRSRPSSAKKTSIRKQLSEEQRKQVQEVFSSLDSDDEGTISVRSTKRAFKALGVNVSKEEIRSYMPAGGDGALVDLESFESMATERLLQHETALKAFSLFDKDGKEFICLEDLERVVRDLGEISMPQEELQEMIEFCDSEGKGFLNRDDFLQLAKRVNL